MSALAPWLDPRRCPPDRPPYDALSPATRALHDALDANARRSGVPYLHPTEPTVQQDLLGSGPIVAWQEGKAAFLFAAEGCWSELPPLYARYGTGATAALIARLKALEGAGAALVCDSGMQATALVFDVLMTPRAHAVLCRQVYNKTRSYMQWLVERLGRSLAVVDDGDHAALEAAITPATRVVFAETFTNPLVRAQDVAALVAVVRRARGTAPDVRLVIDSTIATPWAFATPILAQGWT
ncbi:MAG: PLP-dependent transferase [Vicinamibacterales bacterium]